MKVTRTGKRRAAAINSVKILLTSASLAATVSGWAVISAANGSALTVAQVDTSTSATATVQAWLDSRSITVAVSSATPAASATQASASAAGTTINAAAVTVAPTFAPTATAVPTQVVVQPKIRAHSSK